MGDQFVLTETARPAPPHQGDRIDAWKQEISENYTIMQTFINMEPTSVFQLLSQFSARASEMRAQIGPQEGRREAQFRIRIIDPFIEECDRQFKLHSRICAIHEMDARLAGGRMP